MSLSFGQYIRALREKAGMTQRALSKVVGFRSLAHLSDIESGKRYPARETLPLFATALGVPVNELQSRDVRGPVEALKSLFQAKPEMVGLFLELAELGKEVDAAELRRRIHQKPVDAKIPSQPAPQVVSVPAEVSPTPVQTAPPEQPRVEAAPKERSPKPESTPRVKKAVPRAQDDQPTLF